MYSQWGCTDPQATNYNAGATINDGSCVYPITNYTPSLISNLPDVIQENSGLMRIANFIYTFNDSGSSNLLYELDTNGSVIRSIVVDGATNMDWEAMSANNTHVFIADVGNNNGNRQDLCLYRFSLTELTQDTVHAEKLPFYWNNQTSFASQPNANDFDCEAIFATQDSIVLFSKNWITLTTRRYHLPTFWNDTIAAQLIDSFNVDGLITDACIDSNSNHTYLLGYKNNGNNFYTSFIWCLWDYPGTHYFNGNKRRVEIGNVLNLSQTEGLALSSSSNGFISSEKVVSVITIAPKLFHFDLGSIFESTASVVTQLPKHPFQISTKTNNEWNEIKLLVPFNHCSLTDIQGKHIPIFPTTQGVQTTHHGQALLSIDWRTYLIYLP